LDVATDHAMFVLLEAFDGADLESARQLLATRGRKDTLLIGINSRDLQTLEVVQQRFTALAPLLPESAAGVAESGVATPSDARAMRQLRLPSGVDRYRLDELRGNLPCCSRKS